ncbi:hypothetical protein O6H91_01G022200 [Diphasiastrum complanatum]|uniref:Uncharacterized protein n=1 Tax=Diphasiastrum complanatum TaxID=34168 RepID=A0ACC2ENX6_DIPCM|nr:hypothetical protein O6H91_01G022200 [Diphasiastrum complanatum]
MPMKPFPVYGGELEEPGVGASMDVDGDGDSLDLLGEGTVDAKPFDADFFNSFEDDFDDSDIA